MGIVAQSLKPRFRSPGDRWRIRAPWELRSHSVIEDGRFHLPCNRADQDQPLNSRTNVQSEACGVCPVPSSFGKVCRFDILRCLLDPLVPGAPESWRMQGAGAQHRGGRNNGERVGLALAEERPIGRRVEVEQESAVTDPGHELSGAQPTHIVLRVEAVEAGNADGDVAGVDR